MDNPTPQQQFALSCAGANWWIFPLGVRSKTPDGKLAPHGFESASTDPAQIKRWWNESPSANIGVDLGRSNFTVLDFDQGRPPEEIIPYLQDTYVVKTARGAHVYFQGVAKQGKMFFNGKHIGEVKSAGGYVLAPTSVHPDGPVYTIIGNSLIQPLPEDLLARLMTAPKSQLVTTPSGERRRIPRGQMHHEYMSHVGKLLQMGYAPEDAIDSTLKWAKENLEIGYDEKKVAKEVRDGAERYGQGQWNGLVLNQKPDGADDEEETFADDKEERFPECPIFTGALTDLARALFPSLPMEFKQWGLIARWGLMRSGIDTFGFEKHLQPRFYSIFVCYPNRGKTACINETREALAWVAELAKRNSAAVNIPLVCSEVENLPSVDSGQFLAEEFHKTKVDANCLDQTAKIMMDPDEISDVFEKGRILNGRQSTLFIELLKLYSGNRTGSGTKKDGKQVVTNAHLAILGGTTVKKYPMLWTGTGGGTDGLVSRFIPVTTNNPPLPPVPLLTDDEAAKKAYSRLVRLAQLPPQNVVLTEDAGEMLNEWWTSFDNSKESATRVVETIKQLLIVLAVTNTPEDYLGDDVFTGNTVTVGPDLMKQVIAFGEYLIAVRERLNPGDAWTHVQAMENAIIEWAKRNTSRKEPKTRNQCRQGVHPERKPGGLATFNYAWDSCVKAGVMKLRAQDGKAYRYSL